MKKLFRILPLVMAATLVGCGEQAPEKLEITLLTPAGAPALSIYNMIIDKTASVASQPTDIPGQFSLGTFDYIIFDSVNATKLLTRQGDDAKYEFVKMLTGGNYHLIGLEKEQGALPQEEDNIIGFSTAATGGQLAKKVFLGLNFDYDFDGVGKVKEKLLGEIENDAIETDWALIAEPQLSQVDEALSSKGISYVDYNLQTRLHQNLGDQWNKAYIPQAGLFVRKDFKEENPELHNKVVNQVKSNIDRVFNNLNSITNKISESYESDAQVIGSFGAKVSDIKAAQGDNSNKNGLGVVPNNVEFKVEDITNFTNLLK